MHPVTVLYFDASFWCLSFLYDTIMSASNPEFILYYSDTIQVNTWVYYLYYYKNAQGVYKVDIVDTSMLVVKSRRENTRDALAKWINKHVVLASQVTPT